MLISSFLPSAGGQGSEQRHFDSQAEGQDSLMQALLCDYNNKSNEKQVKETVSNMECKLASSLKHLQVGKVNNGMLPTSM